MNLRVAEQNDIAELVAMGQQFIKEAPNYSNRSIEPKALELNLSQIINGDGAIFLVELNNVTVGGIVCAMTKDWFSDQLIAFEQVFYVKPEYRATRAAIQLIDAFVEWAKSMNADRVQCGTTTGIQTKGCLRLYERFGFREYGTLLDLELQ